MNTIFGKGGSGGSRSTAGGRTRSGAGSRSGVTARGRARSPSRTDRTISLVGSRGQPLTGRGVARSVRRAVGR